MKPEPMTPEQVVEIALKSPITETYWLVKNEPNYETEVKEINGFSQSLIDARDKQWAEMLSKQEPEVWGVKKRGKLVWYINESKSVCQGYAQHYGHRSGYGAGELDQETVPLYTRPIPNEADELLRNLGLDPEQFRTDGGAINHLKVKAAIRHPDDYNAPAQETVNQQLLDDARRYQWLRYSREACVTLPIHGDWIEHSHEHLDVAIDAAIEAAEKEMK